MCMPRAARVGRQRKVGLLERSDLVPQSRFVMIEIRLGVGLFVGDIFSGHHDMETRDCASTEMAVEQRCQVGAACCSRYGGLDVVAARLADDTQAVGELAGVGPVGAETPGEVVAAARGPAVKSPS